MAAPVKKVKKIVKMIIQAQKANPAPPVGSTLGPCGINLKQFCDDFNKQTSGMTGAVPVLVTVYEDRSFIFELKIPPMSELIKQAVGITKGGATTGKAVAGTITMDQIRAVAEKKLPDLNCYTVDQAVTLVLGTCSSMGIRVKKD